MLERRHLPSLRLVRKVLRLSWARREEMDGRRRPQSTLQYIRRDTRPMFIRCNGSRRGHATQCRSDCCASRQRRYACIRILGKVVLAPCSFSECGASASAACFDATRLVLPLGHISRSILRVYNSRTSAFSSANRTAQIKRSPGVCNDRHRRRNIIKQ